MDRIEHTCRTDPWVAWIAAGAGMALTPTAVSGAASLPALGDVAIAAPAILGLILAALWLRPSGYVLDGEALRVRLRGRRVVWPLSSIRRVDLAEWSDARECHVVFDGGAVRRISPRLLPDLAEFAAQLRTRGVEVATL